MVCREKIFKKLTRNDTGETHSHQSGITIPKRVAQTSVFPRLGVDVLNPRTEIVFYDEENVRWAFQYIYYNDLYFGKPKSKAHDEHRLTCVKDFISKYGAKSGDEVWFGVDENGVRRIGVVKNSDIMDKSFKELSPGVVFIKLGTNWRSVKL